LANGVVIPTAAGAAGAGITGAQVKAGITAYIARETEVNNYDPFIAALIAHADITGVVGGVAAIRVIAKSNNYRSKTTLADKIGVISNSNTVVGFPGFSGLIDGAFRVTETAAINSIIAKDKKNGTDLGNVFVNG